MLASIRRFFEGFLIFVLSPILMLLLYGESVAERKDERMNERGLKT